MSDAPMDPRRRGLFRAALRPTSARERPTAPLRPPWALADDTDFTDHCTRCGDCVRACPSALLHAGDGGFPEIRFVHAGCDFCGACRNACGTGAIRTGPDIQAFALHLHVSARCLARQRVECRVCAEMCDAQALRFVPALGGIPALHLDPAACTGCGACVSPCPVGALELRTEPAPAPDTPARISRDD